MTAWIVVYWDGEAWTLATYPSGRSPEVTLSREAAEATLETFQENAANYDRDARGYALAQVQLPCALA